MKKIINTINKHKIYIFNFLLILAILLFILFIKNIFPFGNSLIVKSDAAIQYQPMLYNFIEKIKTGLLESYTFNNGFGAPTIFNHLYYISSPLNILCIFFKSPEGMYTFISLLKICISALTMTFYVKNKTNNNYLSTIMSIGYSLCGWILTYYNFSLWLDTFMVFPLFQYSLEQLMEKGKCKLYIILLAYMLISNFYLAFMVCLYTFAYYMFHIIIKKDKYINKITNFQLIMFSTIISCLLCCFHLYATYDSFLKMGIIESFESNLFEITIPNVLSSLCYGNISYLLSSIGEAFPNIGINILFTISFFYFFLNKKITLKEKIKTLIILLFFIFITFNKTADYIINAFHVTVGFPFRYAFISSFLILLITIKNFKTFENKIDKKVYIITTLLFIMFILLYKFKIITDYVFFQNLAFLICYSIFFIFYNNNKFYKYILLILLILESSIALNNNITDDSIINYETKEFTTIKYRENSRLENETNFNLYKNTNEIRQFSTMNYKRILLYLYKFDAETDGGNHVSAYNTGNIFDMFFNIKTNNNNYYLEKVFAVNKEFKDIDLNKTKNIVVLNEMVYKATGYENALKKIEYDYLDKKDITIKIDKTGFYRIAPQERINLKIYNKDVLIREYKNESKAPAETLYLDEGSSIIITNYKKKKVPINLYIEDNETIKKAHNKLSKNQINYTHYSDSHMEGSITVDKDQIIYTSIPYDKDWEFLIDGKKVEQFKVLGEFMGVKCNEGTHTISLKYKTHYEIPILISIGTAISMIVHEIIKRKKQKDTNFA